MFLIGDRDRPLVGVALGQGPVEQEAGARVEHANDEVDFSLSPVTGEGDGGDLAGDHSLHSQGLPQPLDAGEVEGRGQVIALDAVEQVLTGQNGVAVKLRQLDDERVGGEAADIGAAIPRGVGEVEDSPSGLWGSKSLCLHGGRAEQKDGENGQHHQYRE